MDSEEGQNNGSGKGCLRAFLIIVIGFAALIAAIIATVLILASPGRRQIARLENGSPAEAPAPPPANTEGMTIDIPQAALSGTFESAFSQFAGGIRGAESLGADILLNEDEIDLLAGISGRLPGIGWKRRATLGMKAEVVFRDNGEIAITPNSIAVCRLRIPVKRVFVFMERIPEAKEALSPEGSRWIRIDASEQRVYLDRDVVAAGMPPGAEPEDLRIFPGYLRMIIDVRPELEASADSVLSVFKASRADLLSRLEPALPADDSGFIDSVEALLAEGNDVSAALNRFMETAGRFSALSPEERKAVEDALLAYFDDHPETVSAMERIPLPRGISGL